MRRHPTAPVNVARISVATSGTDFTAPEADFAALIRAAGFRPGRSHLSRGSCRSWDSAWSGPGAKRTNADQSFALASPNLPMTDWSDRHCHASHRLMGRRAPLWWHRPRLWGSTARFSGPRDVGTQDSNALNDAMMNSAHPASRRRQVSTKTCAPVTMSASSVFSLQ